MLGEAVDFVNRNVNLDVGYIFIAGVYEADTSFL
jgi:hypothetical protein